MLSGKPMLALDVHLRRPPLTALCAPCTTGVVFASALCVMAAGCASTGVPRPPSLHLPQPVRDLSAQRFGQAVELRFTVPTLSTDRQSLATGKHGAGVLQAQLCRQLDSPGSTCAVVTTQAVKAGEAVTLRDALPEGLRAGTPHVLHYRVSILNAQGRSSGASRDAVTLSGAAPGALRGLAATTTARGIQLTWVRDAAAAPDTRILLKTEPVAHTLAVPGDPGGAVDDHPKKGETVTYTVVRTRMVPAGTEGNAASVVVNGEPATVTVTRSADVFPPAAPTGLVAVGLQLEGKPSRIDLSWEPNAEPDLAGYLVYRTEGAGPGAGQPILLTPSPIRAISFSDATVQAGQTYSYVLRAVDAAGNRSGPSAAAEESVRP